MEEAIASRLKPYIINSNDALEFKLVRSTKDLDDDETTFKPEMSHQVFGSSETIFGYKDLKIMLYYSACSLETYLGMTFSEKASKDIYDDVTPDDVLGALSEKLSSNVHSNLDMFVKSLSKDKSFKPEGEVIYSFSVGEGENVRHFEVYTADMTSTKFKEYFLRLQTFVLWYIDGANFIDISDDQWHYFNMFERFKAEDGSVCYATVGFANIYQYYAYPNHKRPRISQFLVLPPFQKMGLGANLLKAIYHEYIKQKDVKDITVEDPSEDFQRLRDFVDAENCSKLPSFSKNNLKKPFSTEMATEAADKLKINKKQARRVYEILRLKATNLSDSVDYQGYRLMIKNRLNIPYKKEQNDVKKLEEALKNGKGIKGGVNYPIQEERIKILDKEYRALEDEYKKVVERLERNEC